MFNNAYQMEQAGRMRQQELLQAQQAQDLARAAMATSETAHAKRGLNFVAITRRMRRVLTRPVFALRASISWVTWLFLLVGLLVFAQVPPTAEAADHGGLNQGAHFGIVHDGSDLNGHSAVVEGDRQTTGPAVVDPGQDGRHGGVAAVDPAQDGRHGGSATNPVGATYAVDVLPMTLAGLAVVVLISLIVTHRRPQRSGT